jgi:hypothetical protein
MLRQTMIALAAVAAGCGVAAAPSGAAEFGFEPGTLYADLVDPATSDPAVRAGAPANLELGFRMRLIDPAVDPHGVAGTIKDLHVDLPKGLIADPTPFEECDIPLFLQILVACPATSAVGMANVALANPNSGQTGPPTAYLRNRIFRVPTQGDEAAAFAFAAATTAFPVRMAATASPEGGYRIRTSALQLVETSPLYDTHLTFWGFPAEYQGPGPYGFGASSWGGPLPTSEPRFRFMSVPTRCEGTPLRLDFAATPWSSLYQPFQEGIDLPLPSGCDQLQFDPSITVTPEHQRAGRPAGYKVELDVPQNTDAVNGLETPNLRDAVVTLPKGVAISPPQANGLKACSDAQIDLNGNSAPGCPAESKIGEVVVDTPLLDDPVTGNIFIGSQESNDPMSGEMYRIFIAARAPGVRLKLKGQIRANKETGQLEATFSDNPELPFSKFTLTFKDGDTAPLVNPPCGTHTTTSTLTPWGGPVAHPTADFVIDQECATGQFAPGFNAGTTNPLAGSYAPFTMTLTRSDADQQLRRIAIQMPPGLLAALSTVSLCGDAEAAAGTCSAASRIGAATLDVGAGGQPYRLTGQVHVTGPFKGEPFGLSVVVPAKAGPFDLGTVVDRLSIHVDPKTAALTAREEESRVYDNSGRLLQVNQGRIPEIVGGVPVSLRTVNVTLDRPGFTFNATSCGHQQIGGSFWAASGAQVNAAVGYQAQGCDRLRLSPRLALQWFGKTQMRKGKHPGVRAQLGDMLGQANLRNVKVTLPLTAALDPDNAKALCTVEQAAARNCPAESIVGQASASTPALHERVTGPVYFVKGIRYSATGRAIETLPKLWVPLSAQGVTVDLWADSDVDAKQRLVSTFKDIPDVPVRDFQLEINGGGNGILKATNDVCGASKTTTIEYTGHNGGVTRRNVAFTAPDCKPQIVSAENSRNSTLPVRVGGIGPGTLTLTGSGIGKATRKIVRSDNGLVRASFTRNGKSHLRSGKTLRTRLTVRFKPTKGKAITIRKTVRIKSVKR